ncbi:type II toxin-antitoxin system RelE/ParE family toxin [Kingella negevensis]|uniref:type II toxin-antitoxin system RelE family toxin n=1 Tax=Kingella negevensis TaxID=1522312 RepID=UPI000BA4221A|nr:type II toxin-antitoxin system RelE/ParE family toxin [Kingella negevensis]MDK4685320.1 type II toxin-antitoxin system RelE/ParE family toxin [Kingella negevensis]MDK4697309.1 type II toxin-antitoxin system RelE/ParE family toxin [Kingella negevensis]MDK4706789.1 type II toxin-antitoxin system RelE/ParE family toxin [Kingella negevensis]MDK4708904.1 type II toxin-antitoxin system RelE/ParE family toxin [Kingella negevensis]
MNYRFVVEAEDEWRKLENSTKQQFKSALAKRLENPGIPFAALHGMPDCYKIKLRKIGYRLVYRVDDNVITVTVIAIGKRDKSVVYDVANSRL